MFSLHQLASANMVRWNARSGAFTTTSCYPHCQEAKHGPYAQSGSEGATVGSSSDSKCGQCIYPIAPSWQPSRMGMLSFLQSKQPQAVAVQQAAFEDRPFQNATEPTSTIPKKRRTGHTIEQTMDHHGPLFANGVTKKQDCRKLADLLRSLRSLVAGKCLQSSSLVFAFGKMASRMSQTHVELV